MKPRHPAALLLRAIVSCTFLLAAGPQTASATAMYDYVGRPFTFVAPGSPYATDMFVTATLTLDSALPGGLSFGPIQGFPGFALTISDGVRAFDSIFPGVGPTVFQATTAPDGSIVSWTASTVIIGDQGIFTAGNPPAPSGSADLVFTTNALVLASVTNDPGTWAGPLAPIPEPSTLLLFGSAMAGLGLAGWRKRRRKQQP